MLEEPAISVAADTRSDAPPSSPIGGGGEEAAAADEPAGAPSAPASLRASEIPLRPDGDRDGGGAEPGASPEAGEVPSPTPAPSPDAVVQTILRHHPVEAAKVLGLSVTALAAIVRSPEIQQTLETFRELEADHATRQRQAAQSLAMQALSEILTKQRSGFRSRRGPPRRQRTLALGVPCHRLRLCEVGAIPCR